MLNRVQHDSMIKTKITQTLAKEIGELLASYREKSHLTQAELAKRLCFSQKSGFVSISRMEKGKIKNLSLDLLVGYLTICGKSWSAFFEKLAGIYFSKRHDAVMSQVADVKLDRKIDRDVAKYTHSINTKFAYKQKIKPLTEYQKQRMAVGFAKHRAVMEQIEREITKYLGNSGELPIYNQFYKAFAREYYSVLQKITTKARTHAPFDKTHDDKTISTRVITAQPDKRCGAASSASSAINIKLNQIIEKWVKKGLKRRILEQVKEIPIKYYKINEPLK